MTADVPHSVLVQRPNLLAPVWVPAIPPRALIFHLQRRYNTLSLLDHYLGHGKMSNSDIAWSAADPNLLSMTLPGGLDVTTRVTRRSENDSPPDRLDTSEFFQQVCCYQNGPLTLAHHLRLITASPVPTQISGIWVFQGTLPDCLDTSEYFQQVGPRPRDTWRPHTPLSPAPLAPSGSVSAVSPAFIQLFRRGYWPRLRLITAGACFFCTCLEIREELRLF